MKWWEKYKDYIGEDMGYIDGHGESKETSFSLWNYLHIAKSFIINLFVDVQEGKNPQFSKGKAIAWAILIVLIIIISLL
jgi:hypothetical protein